VEKRDQTNQDREINGILKRARGDYSATLTKKKGEKEVRELKVSMIGPFQRKGRSRINWGLENLEKNEQEPDK